MAYKHRGKFKMYIVNTARHTFRRPRTPYMAANGLCNKEPHEYKESHEYGRNKNGIKWYFRLNRRGTEKNFPFVSWNEDPMGHTTQSPPQMFSARDAVKADTRKIPRWNVYALDRTMFRIDPERARFVQLLPFLRAYVGCVFTSESILAYLKQVQEKFPSIPTLLAYQNVPHNAAHVDDGAYAAKIPRETYGTHPCLDLNCGSTSRAALSVSTVGNGPGSDHITGYHRVLTEKLFELLNPSDVEEILPEIFLLHLVMLCDAIVEQTVALRHRQYLHKNHGVLRMNSGERYFALPQMHTGPAWPVNLAQPPGKEENYADASSIPNVPGKPYVDFFNKKLHDAVNSPEFEEDSECMPQQDRAGIHPVFRK